MFHFFVRILFVSGFLSGVLLAILLSLFQQRSIKSTVLIKNYIHRHGPFVDLYEVWFTKTNLKHFNISIDLIRYSNNKYLTESQYLYDKVQVLCAILVRNAKNAEAAQRTWAKHCNSIVLINLELKKKNKIPVKKTKDNASWALLCKSLRDFSDSFKWILIVNDNTFAILENIRYLVAGLNHTKKYYLGHAMTFWGTSYNSGQAGYILSNGTLAALKNKLKTSSFCTADSTFWNMEDYYLGKTLASLNISPLDTRDKLGLATFHGFNLQKLFFPGSTALSNYYKFSLFPTKCCSFHSVTFQVTEGDKMFTYDYLLHQLQVFKDGNLGNKQPTTPVPQGQVWQSILEEQNITDMNISAKEYYKLWENIVSDGTSFAQELRKQESD
ncbi:hypothetical protein ILUMI_04146 [Ignelater luminosus]|uniref:Uncharacterized protein n=1 Tax=Ignelater luminosus TaxID=2038154 RepID=A0A8K0DFA7_IGNLU|nr:hypothetical protein ILUMI_04146 [Ignelater luminosus]